MIHSPGVKLCLWSAVLGICAVLLASCGGGGIGSAPTPPASTPVSVSISPSTATLLTGEAQQFRATVSGSTNQSVRWQVNGKDAGDSVVGSIDGNGLYTAPLHPPSPNSVNVTAISMADTSKQSSAAVAVDFPAPTVTGISPSLLDAGSPDTQITVTGSNFFPESVVLLQDSPLVTVLDSSTQMRATLPASSLTGAGTMNLKVKTPAPGGGTSAQLALKVQVVVSVTPATVGVETGANHQFTATVLGSSNQSVTWSVNDIAGGNSTVGTINPAGLYTAPVVPPVPNSVTISAVSSVDPARSGAASVDVTNPAPAITSILPTSIVAGSGDTVLTVNGSGFTPQSQINWNGAALTTLFSSSSQLSAAVPAAELANAGVATVGVSTPVPGGGSSGTLKLTILLDISVSPASPSLLVNGTQQFTATIVGSGDQSASWYVNDIADGNSTVGTISASGLYTAPDIPPVPNSVTIKAVSTVDHTRTATTSLTVSNPAPVISSIAPANIIVGGADTELTVKGSNFTPQSQVLLAGTNLTTAFDSSAQLRATVPSAQLASVTSFLVQVNTPAPGGGTSATRTLQVIATMTVSPSSKTLRIYETKQFTATVNFTSDQSVVWDVDGISGGNATVGTISTSGLYLAPAAIPSGGNVTIHAVSAVDSGKSAAAPVTITLATSDNYPRSDASSVLRASTTLPLYPTTGTAVAVLDWTAKDPDSTQEDILALCHAFIAMGIPHVHTTDVTVAAGYPFLAVAGVLGSLNSTDRTALTDYVNNGGTLFLWEPSDSGLLTNLGIVSSSNITGSTSRLLDFDLATADPALAYIDHDVEVHWQMTYPQFGITRSYDPGVTTVLGTWNGANAAAVRSNLGTGRAYVFGWRLRHIISDGERLRIPGPEPPWTNVPVLDSDICKLLLRGVYEAFAGAGAVERQFAPGGHHAAFIITHDVDAPSSYDNMQTFVDAENTLGIKSTYNFTTDAYDAGWTGLLYTLATRADVQLAIDNGFDVQSHSFGHFPDFNKAPYGTGTEDASNYMPEYSWELGQTFGMSVLGELGVSRWLLEHDFGITISSFRTGHLLFPTQLAKALSETGYRRDSSTAAGVTRGSLPYVLFTVSGSAVTTYPVVEYPLALSDDGMDATNFTARMDAWENVIRANYANNIPTMLLIHNSDRPLRLESEQEILNRVKDLDLWIGDWKTFAEFWENQGVTCSRFP